MMFLKLPLKLLAIPVMILLAILSLFGKLLTNLSAHIVGLFMLVVLLIGIYCLWGHRWMDVMILGAVEVICMAVQFGSMFLAELAGEWSGSLRVFIRS
jgi:hypothetical protein